MDGRIAFTPREACEALRIGKTKFYQLLANGELKAVALGRKTLVSRDALENFMASLPVIHLQRTHDADAPQNSVRRSPSGKDVVRTKTTSYAVAQKRCNPSPATTK
jgi:excisionase family DNA binding protein